MLLKSKDRPKADGLPMPSVEPTAGLCKQVGNFVTLELYHMFSDERAQHGQKYELQYQSAGIPMAVRRIKRRESVIHPLLMRATDVQGVGCKTKGRRRKPD